MHPDRSSWPRPIPNPDEKEYTYWISPTGRLPYRSRFEEHIHIGWKEHYDVQVCPKAEEHTLMHFLSKLCGIAPNLRGLVLVDRGFRQTIQMTDNELAKYCRWADCSIPREAHAMFRLSTKDINAKTLAIQLYDLVPINGWRRIMLEQDEDGSRMLRVEVMDWFARAIVSPQIKANLVSNLKVLKLDLDDGVKLDFNHITGAGILARSFTNVNNLEQLEIRR